MFGIKRANVHSYERGLLFEDGEFQRVLAPGRHWVGHLLKKVNIHIVDCRTPWLRHPDLDLIVASGKLEDQACVLDLKDYERALVWIDGRFNAIVGGGLYALWQTHRQVRIEILDARSPHFDHRNQAVILKAATAKETLEEVVIPENHVGVYYSDGQFSNILKAGRHCFWKGVERFRVELVDLSEQCLDISGQEIMTADKVSLRLNAVVAYRVSDPQQAIRVSADVVQSLYRHSQLALRSVVGTQPLDALLSDKDLLTDTWHQQIISQSDTLGLEILFVGIRDMILPGDMKELLNKVTEAQKAAEANLISRREETAAMRSQANTAKLLENPL